MELDKFSADAVDGVDAVSAAATTESAAAVFLHSTVPSSSLPASTVQLANDGDDGQARRNERVLSLSKSLAHFPFLSFLLFPFSQSLALSFRVKFQFERFI